MNSFMISLHVLIIREFSRRSLTSNPSLTVELNFTIRRHIFFGNIYQSFFIQLHYNTAIQLWLSCNAMTRFKMALRGLKQLFVIVLVVALMTQFSLALNLPSFRHGRSTSLV